MEKFKEYFKMFSYIFYPGVALIFYLAQGLEGKMGLDLIFCPTDLVVMAIIVAIYLLLDGLKVFEAKIFNFMKKADGRIKVPYLLLILLIIAALMGLYDNLKIYYYLNNEVSVSLLIVIAIWLVLLGVSYLLNKQEK